jgi:hypothetical protein
MHVVIARHASAMHDRRELYAVSGKLPTLCDVSYDSCDFLLLDEIAQQALLRQNSVPAAQNTPAGRAPTTASRGPSRANTIAAATNGEPVTGISRGNTIAASTALEPVSVINRSILQVRYHGVIIFLVKPRHHSNREMSNLLELPYLQSTKHIQNDTLPKHITFKIRSIELNRMS